MVRMDGLLRGVLVHMSEQSIADSAKETDLNKPGSQRPGASFPKQLSASLPVE